MKFFLSIILAIVVASLVASSNSEDDSSTRDYLSLEIKNDPSLFNSTEITDPRVKILDFEGKPTFAVVNEKTNKVYVTDFYAGKGMCKASNC